MRAGKRALSAAIAQTIGRREFLAASTAIGAVAAMPAPTIAQGPKTDSGAVLLDDWTVDDMWTGYPRHAENLAFPIRRDVEIADVARVRAEDRDWIA